MSDPRSQPQLLNRLSSFFGARPATENHPLFNRMATLITSTYDLDTLVNGTLDMLSRELTATYVKIVLLDRDELLFFNSVGQHTQKMYPEDITRLEALSPPRILKITEAPESGLKSWMQNFELEVMCRLEVHGNRVGHLFLGHKANSQPYSREELDMLGVITEQLAVAFANALAVRRISRFNEELKAEVERATRELAKANEELKQLDKLKDEFVSMASHELKSPLNAVKNYLWLALNKGKDDPAKLESYLDTAHRATDQVLVLVNDLLDVSRIESGRLTLVLEPISVKQTVDDTLAIFSPVAAQKDLTISVDINPNLTVKADTVRFHEITSNLISNALKYTIKGGITIKAEDQGDMVRIKVSDTGIGVKKEDQLRLFDKFSRLKTNYKELAEVEGTGLGLFITKKLVELMGGTIGIESEEGQGSTFWFTLPKT